MSQKNTNYMLFDTTTSTLLKTLFGCVKMEESCNFYECGEGIRDDYKLWDRFLS